MYIRVFLGFCVCYVTYFAPIENERSNCHPKIEPFLFFFDTGHMADSPIANASAIFSGRMTNEPSHYQSRVWIISYSEVFECG